MPGSGCSGASTCAGSTVSYARYSSSRERSSSTMGSPVYEQRKETWSVPDSGSGVVLRRGCAGVSGEGDPGGAAAAGRKRFRYRGARGGRTDRRGAEEIGRASCRERGWSGVEGGWRKEKATKQ